MFMTSEFHGVTCSDDLFHHFGYFCLNIFVFLCSSKINLYYSCVCNKTPSLWYFWYCATVAVTQLLWRPRGLLVDQFDSKEDLIDAVFTSSFIPGWLLCTIFVLQLLLCWLIYEAWTKSVLQYRYLAPRPATMFRNRLCIDGGLTLFMPPTSATQTVLSLNDETL